jgi:lipopolysaccharide/colanic/teichoic acid biosynthesis glycosyltransferase
MNASSSSKSPQSPQRGLGMQQPPPVARPGRARGLNSLYSRAQLESVLHRERLRADRNRTEFSLILFRVRAEDRRLTLRLARLLLRRSRGIDELGWFDTTCVAALLPYTNGEGARAFAESTLKLAQDQLIPAICRIYTYPSAWYFEEDRHNGHGKTRSSDLVVAPINGNGNGNGNGHANGNGRSNGNGHARYGENGNGHANGNGHGHANGNGNGNGNGHHKLEGLTVSPEAAIDRRGGMTRTDLLPYVMQGLSDGLRAPDAGTEGVETLLVQPLPWWKRAIDIVGAGMGLLVLSPVMILSALAIKGTSHGPVIFKQRRAGLGGRPFWIYKFRTMTIDAEAKKAALRSISEQDGPAFKLSNDPRVTGIGKFLRETSLDELPQLWNVIKGDMSLVGPRPLPMDESAECEQWQRSRLDVTPGLTCIWQVKGRSRVTFDQWMRMDVNYIRRRNFFHDIKILTQTIPAVLLRKGAR